MTIANEWEIHPAEKQKMIAYLSARLEWVRTRQTAKSQAAETAVENDKSCYFNTGCCSFSDGDVTGLEIVDNKIRLVRWPDDQGEPGIKILAEASLRHIFRTLKTEPALVKQANGHVRHQLAAESFEPHLISRESCPPY